MSQPVPPGNGDKKIIPPPPPPGPDPLFSRCSARSSTHLPQRDTFIGQHVSPNNSRGQAQPSYRALTSSNNAVATEDSFQMVNIYFYLVQFAPADH